LHLLVYLLEPVTGVDMEEFLVPALED
jgi:hypothetical protein